MTAAPPRTNHVDLLRDAVVDGDEYTAGDVVAAALEDDLDTPHSLGVGLELLAAELRDFPRASRFLAEGTTHLERISA